MTIRKERENGQDEQVVRRFVAELVLPADGAILNSEVYAAFQRWSEGPVGGIGGMFLWSHSRLTRTLARLGYHQERRKDRGNRWIDLG